MVAVPKNFALKYSIGTGKNMHSTQVFLHIHYKIKLSLFEIVRDPSILNKIVSHFLKKPYFEFIDTTGVAGSIGRL